jgi:hypothetical protein
MWRSLNVFLVRSVPTPYFLKKYLLLLALLTQGGNKLIGEVVTLVLMDFPVFWNIAPYTNTIDSEDFSASIFTFSKNNSSKIIELFPCLCVYIQIYTALWSRRLQSSSSVAVFK